MSYLVSNQQVEKAEEQVPPKKAEATVPTRRATQFVTNYSLSTSFRAASALLQGLLPLFRLSRRLCVSLEAFSAMLLDPLLFDFRGVAQDLLTIIRHDLLGGRVE